MRIHPALLASAALLAAAPAAAQQRAAGPITAVKTEWSPVPNATFPVPKGMTIKVGRHVDTGAEKPGDPVPGFVSAAAMVNQAAEAGVAPGKFMMALVVHGTATPSLLTNDAYKAKFGVDNPNIELLRQLEQAGVQIIVCGQALPRRGVPREQLLPLVKVSLSATWAEAVLQQQGYAF